jgi:hypothetical protein
MNQHKLRAIVEFVRGRGPLPTDQFGEILDAEDLLAWFGLTGTLSLEERTCVARELAMMREAQAFIERLQLKAL